MKWAAAIAAAGVTARTVFRILGTRTGPTPGGRQCCRGQGALLRLRLPYIRAVVFDVRSARLADIERLQMIENAADERFLTRFNPESWWPAGPGQERAALPGFILVVAESADEDAVGFVHVLEVEGRAHLEQLAVLPAYGQRGLGRALVIAGLMEAARRGYSCVTLRTYADVPWNAPSYEHCGFPQSQPDHPFLLGLVTMEERVGLSRYGRRVQMTALTC